MRHVKVEGQSENLEQLVSGGWFDTVNAGMKNEKGSYERIAEEMKVSSSFFRGRFMGLVAMMMSLRLTCLVQLAPEAIMFLSDNVKEVEAALAAGMKSLVVDRPGNAALSTEDRDRFIVVDSFEKITIL